MPRFENHLKPYTPDSLLFIASDSQLLNAGCEIHRFLQKNNFHHSATFLVSSLIFRIAFCSSAFQQEPVVLQNSTVSIQNRKLNCYYFYASVFLGPLTAFAASKRGQGEPSFQFEDFSCITLHLFRSLSVCYLFSGLGGLTLLAPYMSICDMVRLSIPCIIKSEVDYNMILKINELGKMRGYSTSNFLCLLYIYRNESLPSICLNCFFFYKQH